MVRFYPNPVNDKLNIEVQSTSSTRGLLGYELISPLGRIILQGNLNLKSTNQIDVSALPSGLYILKLQIDGNAQAHQVNILR